MKGKKENILSFIAELPERIKKENLVFRYDADSDSLVIRRDSLSSDVKKEYVNKDLVFYLNGDREVEGMFIEYFTSNFVNHHKELKKKIKMPKVKGVVQLDEKKTKKLADQLRASIMRPLVFN